VVVGRESTADGAGRRTGAVRAALAVVVVAAVVLGAVLLRPGAGLLGKGRGPLGGHAPVVVLLAVAWLFAGLSLNSRIRARIPYDPDLGPVEQRLSDAARYMLLLAPLVVPVLVLALHRFSGSGNSGSGAGGVTRSRRVATRHPLSPQPVKPVHRTGPVHHHGLVRILTAVCVVVLVAAVACAAVFLWRRLVGPVARPYEPQPAPAADERERLAEAVDSGRRALLADDDPRTAVIACYAAMEESLAASGIARQASDSPQDLLERALASGLPAAGAAADLTGLFREARYSTHPMDGGHRDRAAAALTAIAEGLAAREPGPEAAP
jgi:hypothetical protein